MSAIFNVTPDNVPQTEKTQSDTVDVTPPVNKTEAKNTINPDGSPMDPERKEEPMVIIDGPLGRIYTQALNLAYANEDTGTMAVLIGEGARQRERESAGGPRGTHVLAMDMGDLSAGQLVEVSDWLGQNKGQGDAVTGLIISVESRGSISKHTGLLEELAKAHGAKVFYSRESAMEAIHVAVKTQSKPKA